MNIVFLIVKYIYSFLAPTTLPTKSSTTQPTRRPTSALTELFISTIGEESSSSGSGSLTEMPAESPTIATTNAISIGN